MYLLDTNVVSLFDVRRSADDLLEWVKRNEGLLYVSVVTFLEIESGRLKLLRADRHRRAGQIGSLLRLATQRFADRILDVDLQTALAAARLGERARAHAIEAADLLIAATAEVHEMTVLTRNLRHFVPTGVPVLDPLARLPPDA